MIKIDKNIVEQVTWEQDPDTFDQRLHALGNSHNEFIIVNPKYEWILDYIDIEEPISNKCIVWSIDNLWLIKKFKQSWTPSVGWQLIHCKLDLEQILEFNTDVRFVNDSFKNKLNEFKINFEELDVEHIWYVDPTYNPDEEKVWVAKCRVEGIEITGTKDMGYLSPEFIYNPDIPDMDYYIKLDIPYHHYDFNYELVWMLDNRLHNDEDEIWAAKLTPDQSLGTKVQGNIGVTMKDFDVVFISYNESNSEANWYRVLEICSTAKRVRNVKGIFEAHKKAAEIATTDMFYVVDGDAELIDNWKFDFRPNVFDMDCVHLWTSSNPINDLEYGYGGVKLFPRKLLLDTTTWRVDLTTGLGKLKFHDKVSNITGFNTDPFGTWRSAFRECAKLSSSLQTEYDLETEERLNTWTTIGSNRQYGEYAIHGAVLGKQYGIDNFDNLETLKLINNYEWMKNEFDKFYKH